MFMEILPTFTTSGYVYDSYFDKRPLQKSAAKTNQLSKNLLYQVLRGAVTFCAIVISSCVANSAIHNGAQPPMGSIMLKCTGVLLSLFTACVTFGGTTGVITSLGMGRMIADFTGCLTSVYVLYFSFSHPVKPKLKCHLLCTQRVNSTQGLGGAAPSQKPDPFMGGSRTALQK